MKNFGVAVSTIAEILEGKIRSRWKQERRGNLLPCPSCAGVCAFALSDLTSASVVLMFVLP